MKGFGKAILKGFNRSPAGFWRWKDYRFWKDYGTTLGAVRKESGRIDKILGGSKVFGGNPMILVEGFWEDSGSNL